MGAPAHRAFAGLEKINLEGLRFRIIDAEGQVVGRLAAQLAKLLQGKDKPTFSPSKDGGDVCVVVNAEKIVFTGRKWDGKLYQWHTGRPGGLREMTARELWRRDPTELLTRAVEGMLPKNNLQRDRLRKLRVFAGAEHPFGSLHLAPWRMPPKQLEDHKLGWLMPAGFAPMNPAAYARRMRGSRRPAGLAAPAAGGGAPQQREGGGGSGAAAAAAGPAGAGAPDVRRGRGDGVAEEGVRYPEPAVSFDDLLASDERQFIEECKGLGASGVR